MSLRKLFIVTGDASGDVHAAKVVEQIQRALPQTEVQALGGVALRATGIELFAHETRTGVFGLGVLGALPAHLRLGKRLIDHFKHWKPDAVLLVDYGMFNLWLAQQLKPLGIKVFYYIPPQIWASRPWRLQKIKRFVHHVFTIFPFEAPWYQREGIAHTYVGHPLAEQCVLQPDREAFCRRWGLDAQYPIIGLFPGSRYSEVGSLLPAFIEALPLIQQRVEQPCQFVLAKSSAIDGEQFEAWLAPLRETLSKVSFTVVEGQNHEVLALAQAALVASGTVTLEAALYQTPVVIAYKLSWFAYWLFKPFVLVHSIGLPNLLSASGKRFLPELMMADVAPQKLADALLPYLSDTSQRREAEAEFIHIQQTLGQTPASWNVVQALSRLMDEPLVPYEVTSVTTAPV